MKIYMVAWITDRSFGKSLTKKKADKRLLSYFFIKAQNVTMKSLKIYYKTGKCDPRKNKQK